MWRDLETVETPDLPAAKAALTQARQPGLNALTRWRGQQDAIDRSHVTANNLPRSEYRLKLSKCGQRQIVQMRERKA